MLGRVAPQPGSPRRTMSSEVSVRFSVPDQQHGESDCAMLRVRTPDGQRDGEMGKMLRIFILSPTKFSFRFYRSARRAPAG